MAQPFVEVTQVPERDVEFAVFHAKTWRVDKWNILLVYTYVPSAEQAICEDTQIRLAQHAAQYGGSGGQAKQTLARGAEIAVVPELPGCRFNPQRARFRWLEDWHCVEFRTQASSDVSGFECGETLNGRVSFYVGPILIGEVKIWVYLFDVIEKTMAW